MVLCQHVLSITTLTIIYNFSVLIVLNFNLIPSVKVSGNSDRLAESITNTINTLHAKFRHEMNTTHFNCLRLSLCQESQKPRILSLDFSQPDQLGSDTDKQTDRQTLHLQKVQTP